MKTVEKKCRRCSGQMSVRLADHKRGRGNFCSRRCSAAYGNTTREKPKANCKCAYCGQEFHRSLSKQKNSKSGLQFCDRFCKESAQKIGGIEAIQPDHYNTGTTGSKVYRRIAFEHHPKQCNRCGYSKCESCLEVHHRDRDRTNQAVSNLEVLCRNCHGEEHHLDE